MALTKCKECKKEVSTSAKTCPHCGVKDPGFGAKTEAWRMPYLDNHRCSSHVLCWWKR